MSHNENLVTIIYNLPYLGTMSHNILGTMSHNEPYLVTMSHSREPYLVTMSQ